MGEHPPKNPLGEYVFQATTETGDNALPANEPVKKPEMPEKKREKAKAESGAAFSEQVQESQETSSFLETYIDKTEINSELKKAADGFLAADAEEESKLGAAGLEGLAIIKSIRADLAEEKSPPETPFALMNYLKAKISHERETIEVLDEMAKKGDSAASAELSKESKILESFFSAQNELFKKATGKNLREDAEKKVAESGFPGPKKYVEMRISAKSAELEQKRNQKLLEREWDEFSKLPEKEKLAYQENVGHQISNKEEFFKSIMSSASLKYKIEGPAFFGLLALGYKPHKTKSRFSFSGFFSMRMSRLEMPRANGEPFVSDGTKEDFDSFVEEAGEQYKASIALQAEGMLEDSWEKEHEQKIGREMDGQIEQFLTSPDGAENMLRDVFAKAKEKRMADCIKEITEGTAERGPKIKESRKIVDVADFIADTLLKQGQLANLDFSQAGQKRGMAEIKKYLRSGLGASAAQDASKKITSGEYALAGKKPDGLFYLILKIINKTGSPLLSARNLASSVEKMLSSEYQKGFFSDNLPQMGSRQRLELIFALKDICLLNEKEKRALAKARCEAVPELEEPLAENEAEIVSVLEQEKASSLEPESGPEPEKFSPAAGRAGLAKSREGTPPVEEQKPVNQPETKPPETKPDDLEWIRSAGRGLEKRPEAPEGAKKSTPSDIAEVGAPAPIGIKGRRKAEREKLKEEQRKRKQKRYSKGKNKN